MIKLSGNVKFGCNDWLKRELVFLGLFILRLASAYRIKMGQSEMES